MDDGMASTTAIGTALMRAAHTRLDRPPLIDDPWGDRLVLAPEREAMAVRAGTHDLDTVLGGHPSYGTVIMRSRYAEDALADAVARGARQYVLIGAGMDSFALRRPPFARALEIFEVDHPATQPSRSAGLRAAISRCRRAWSGGRGPQPDEPRRGARKLVLSPRSADLLLVARGVALPHAHGQPRHARGNRILCARRQRARVQLHRSEPLGVRRRAEPMQRARALVASVGEPWVSGFDPDQIDGDLRRAGLELVENLGPDELGARYCSGRSDGLHPSPGSHLAHARVSS